MGVDNILTPLHIRQQLGYVLCGVEVRILQVNLITLQELLHPNNQ